MAIAFNKKTLIMGILNVTPDSFYDGGKYDSPDAALERARELYDDGADIIDIGGESTRPGAEEISIQEEIDRVCPVIESISKDIDIPISIDTYKSKVAEEALKLGAEIVNDISGLTFDKNMVDIVAKHRSYVILMHIKGTPKDMQIDPKYDNLLEEIYSYLEDAKNKALACGIAKEKIIIDPGIGFGKTLHDNYKIIRNLQFFKRMGIPLLIGLSMKSLIGKLYNEDNNRLYATIALNAVSAMYGADIIRVHDVKAHKLAFKSIEILKREKATSGF